jgi:hypothetical protein
MRNLSTKRQPAGFVSYLLVLTTATLLSLLSIYAYRRAMTAHKVESQVQLRIDYSEKDEAILRAIVANVPNKAMLAMQPGSAGAAAGPLSWASIFNESLAMANSRTSIPAALEAQMGLPAAGARKSNTTDSTGALLVQNVFREIQPLNPALPGLVTTGSGPAQALGANYPPLLNFQQGPAGARDAANDRLYPIVTNTKQYGTLAAGRVGLVPETIPGEPGVTPGKDYQRFNLMPYPQINFPYGTPGEDFIAKRNWWAFSLDVGAQDAASTNLARVSRDFVLSIYEIPSQLSISSAAFTELGTNTGLVGGGDWQRGLVNVDGGVFTGRASVRAPANAASASPLTALASRGGMTVAAGAVIGGQAMSGAGAVAGDREAYLITRGGVGLANNTTLGDFYPVSRASDSGRLAFIPISAGDSFYDRFMQADFAFDKYNPNPATNALSSTAWNDYTIGARQCAMQLDITAVISSVVPFDLNTLTTTFSYLVGGVRTPLPISTTAGAGPPKYIRIGGPGKSFDFGPNPIKFAYGSTAATCVYKIFTNRVVFNDDNFPDSGSGIKSAFMPSAFEPVESLAGATVIQTIIVYPERLPLLLAALGADNTSINNSLVVNVNYAAGVGVSFPTAPVVGVPATAINARYTLKLDECLDLTSFTRGFSLVTNMNLNFLQPFNDTPFLAANLPAGFIPAVTPSNPLGRYYPPCSTFAPSKQYGYSTNALPRVIFGGQLNSLRGENNQANAVNPLNARDLNTGVQIPAANLEVNFRKIRHPLELPPINMMNWMVLLEEKRREY